MILSEQSPQRVMDVRAKLYELLSHCIPPTVIIKVRCLTCLVLDLPDSFGVVLPKTIADRLVERVDEGLKADIMHWAAIYVCHSRFLPSSLHSHASVSLVGKPHAAR